MNLLLLGGTSDARKVVKALDVKGLLDRVHVIYSVAGLVRIPELPCTVISGGFTQFGGLKQYLMDQQIDLLLDVTHPFAEQMSTTAVNAARDLGIPCWRFHREAWQSQPGDQWKLFYDWDALLKKSKAYKSLFLTAGQLSQSIIDELTEQAKLGQQQVLRTAAPPQAKLPESMAWVKAIGPFKHDDELAALKEHNVDLLISKNSGGKATEAKLSAARELGIEVFMLERPSLPEADQLFRTIDACADGIEKRYTEQQLRQTDSNPNSSTTPVADFSYELNPQAIEQDSFRQIRELTDLSAFDKAQQQVVMRIVHSLGMPELAAKVRFSEQACQAGMEALANDCNILCDVEMVKQGITKRMVNKTPFCYLNDPQTAELAKQRGETRSMTALESWREQLKGSVVVIGNAPTALFRLLEMIQAGADKPALIIGMPVGFVGAAESKDALWSLHQTLGLECITLLGRQGGSAVSAASCNALLRCNRGEYY